MELVPRSWGHRTCTLEGGGGGGKGESRHLIGCRDGCPVGRLIG